MRSLAGLTAVVVLAVSGCAEPQIAFREVQRLDDTLRESDIELLERIAGKLNGGRLPEMAPHFVSPPNWASDRPASVATLAREELARVRTGTRLSVLSESLGREVRLAHLLKREKMTVDQYAGLVLAVGTASQRGRLDASQDLGEYVATGRRRLKSLADREESFASLTRQEQVNAVEQATWVTRVDRAERLARIPEENVTLARKVRSRLEKVLPRQFLVPPLAGINVPLLDAGVPFREGPETGFDSELFWSSTDERAVIGGKSVAAEKGPEAAYR